jgi:hypothetical protein
MAPTNGAYTCGAGAAAASAGAAASPLAAAGAAAQGGRRVQRRQAGGQRRGGAAVHVQRDAAAIGRDGQVLPGGGRERLAGLAALAVHFDEGHALVDTDQQRVAGIAAGVHQLLAGRLVGAHPGAEGEGARGGHGQRGAGGQHQRRAAGQLRGAADHAVDRGGHGRLGVVAVAGGVARRRARGAVEVVDQRVVGVERQLAIGRGRGLLVAVVHPDVLALAVGQFRQVDPDQRHAQQRIEGFQLVVQHGLVIAGHEADVGALLVDAVEGEVAGVQAHQQRRAAGGAAQRRALRRAVDGDLLAVLPVGLPPGVGGGRQHAGQHGQ